MFSPSLEKNGAPTRTKPGSQKETPKRSTSAQDNRRETQSGARTSIHYTSMRTSVDLNETLKEIDTENDVTGIEQVQDEQQSESPAENPSPVDFETFVPWACLQAQILVNVVIVKRKEEPLSVLKKKPSSVMLATKIKSLQNEPLITTHSGSGIASKNSNVHSVATSTAECQEYRLPIIAYYNERADLVEINLKKCGPNLPCKLFKILNISIPFQTSLKKIKFLQGTADKVALYYISKVLPLSSITEVILDGNIVKEANYYVLLDETSRLSHLSLSRCSIVDEIVLTLADRLKFGKSCANSLQILNLSSNFISDNGAKYLAEMLRGNRQILLLNLSGNQITNVGAKSICNVLMKFPLTADEIISLKERRIDHFKFKQEMIEEKNRLDQLRTEKKNVKSPLNKKSNQKQVETEKKVYDAEFVDVFDDANVAYENKTWYCLGNFRLASLNLGYNELDYMILKHIVDLFAYQANVTTNLLHKGLLRIILNGNYIPDKCDEWSIIENFINLAYIQNIVPKGQKKGLGSRTASKATNTYIKSGKSKK